jgi:hypothetical protein
MALDTTLPQWSFLGISFNRINPTKQVWLAPEAIANTEPILDSATNVYVDIGGVNVPALAVSGSFENKAQRDLMLSKFRLSGVLSNGRGRSRTMLLYSAVETFEGVPALWTADLVFTLA